MDPFYFKYITWRALSQSQTSHWNYHETGVTFLIYSFSCAFNLTYCLNSALKVANLSLCIWWTSLRWNMTVCFQIKIVLQINDLGALGLETQMKRKYGQTDIHLSNEQPSFSEQTSAHISHRLQKIAYIYRFVWFHLYALRVIWTEDVAV